MKKCLDEQTWSIAQMDRVKKAFNELDACILPTLLWVLSSKKLVVLDLTQSDRLDSPAGVIRSLFQADSFPCSVASLGRTNLFKALDSRAYAQEPMATRNLIRAPGKREISSSPLPLTKSIQPRSQFTGYTQAIATASHSLNNH